VSIPARKSVAVGAIKEGRKKEKEKEDAESVGAAEAVAYVQGVLLGVVQHPEEQPPPPPSPLHRR